MNGRASTLAPKKAHLWERNELDWYVEPESVTESLLRVERFIGAIWDPACGQGNIVKTVLRLGFDASGTDKCDRGLASEAGWLGERDFLADDLPDHIPANIVCNPPFFRAVGTEAFIRRALAVATGKVAMFVDIKFLAGGKRASGLYADHPPNRIYILAKRPSCPPGALLAGDKAQGGTADWCWLVWDLTAPRGDTRLIWLRDGAALEAAE